MRTKRLFLPLFIIISLFIWIICPWNNSSLASESFYSVHTAHGHPTGHEEETHHASKGDEHGCNTSISYSKEDTSSKISSIYLEAMEMETSTHQATTVTIQLFDPHPPKFLIHLYQIYSVYLL